MNSFNEGNLSIDETILDYLSKKGVTDQTEQLALAKISSKVGTIVEQVESSLERLRAKDWVRRYKMPGKVSFELTPKGKSELVVLAKAHTAHITSQLQQSIHQERQAKLRTNVINKLESIGDEWQKYQVPDMKLTGEIEQETVKFLAATKETQAKQPFCHVTPENYDQEFTQYKTQIENLTNQNNNLTKTINNYAKIRNNLQTISADIEKISKSIKKYEPVPQATVQIEKLKTALSKLKSIQSQLENFDKNQLSRLEELKTKLADNSKILEALKKPTHEFTPVKREGSTEKTARYQDPEGPNIYDRQTSRYAIEEKCSKCGIKRKSAPVNLG